MISPRKELEREVRKASIMQATLRVFEKKGIEAATLDEIATEAGFGRATLYYYFPCREDLFSHIFESGWIRLWAAIGDLVDADHSPRRKFIDIVSTIGDLVISERLLYTFLFSAPKISIQNQSWKTYQDRLYKVLRTILEDGIATGEFPDIPPGLLMRAVGGVFHGLLFLNEGKGQVDNKAIEELIERVIQLPRTPDS